MSIGERIKKRRLNLGMTADDLADEISKSRATIYRYENGDIENLPVTILEPLAEALRTTSAYLMGWDDDPTDWERIGNDSGIHPPKDYEGSYEDYVKFKVVDEREDAMREEYLSPTMQKVISRIPVFSTPVSAGDGEWLSEGTEYEWANFENVPNNTDFALKVKGDSMSPVYNDGDIVFIRQSTFIESGDVGVFRLNGEGYLKMLKGSNLISLNPKYEPVTIKENDDYYPAGKVVGKH